jgi:hypothetical protein
MTFIKSCFFYVDICVFLSINDIYLQSYIDEACFRWNTRKKSVSERFTDMFNRSIGLIKPNKAFKLCIAA